MGVPECGDAAAILEFERGADRSFDSVADLMADSDAGLSAMPDLGFRAWPPALSFLAQQHR